MAASPSFHVQPYLGMVVQLPLETTLAVQKGDVYRADDADLGTDPVDRPPRRKRSRIGRAAAPNCATAPAFNQAQLTIDETTGLWL